MLLALWLAAPVTPALGQHESEASIGAFPRKFLSNSVGLVAWDNLVPLFVGSSLTLTARAADHDVQAALADKATGIGDVGDAVGSRFVVLGAITTVFAVGQLTPNDKFRAVTFDLAQGFVINGIITTALKRSFSRMRPDSTNHHSFPSGHTSAGFTIATILARHIGPEAAVPAVLAATFIGISRIEDNEHYLADVLAGATLGYIVGRTVTQHLVADDAHEPATLSISPFVVTRGGGLMLAVRF